MSIDFSLTNHIAVITINRPERRNALDAEHYKALSDAWLRVRDDHEVRVAVVTGAGDKSFCAGADLKTFANNPAPLADMWLTQKDPIINRGLEVWKPVIAAVNGHCLGGGMTMLMATDVRVAVPHATFGLSEVKRGCIAGNGGTQRILKQLPYAVAMELLLTGDAMSASEAERWGLVNKVVEPARLMEEAMAYAGRIAANAPLAVQAAKELARRGEEMDWVTGLRVEQMWNRVLRFSDDAREGPLAFAEKRPPRFVGR
ncbi:MAG TPA: enoyl-CoA hydratase-related protein [Burkholderiales bacterium]|nr:enoyl-CoA hydratase-related protein [Burkholderiales bacterium]